MKKAYLFGAAALLILLIVVAFISSNRQKEEAVCPPQVVGPTAAPLVLVNDEPQNVARQLFADGEFMTDEELNERLERLRGGPGPLTRQGLVTMTDDELLAFRPTDVDPEGNSLLLPPLGDYDELMRELRDSIRKTPIGGPSPIPSLLQSEICPYVPASPFTPSPYASYEPGEETAESIIKNTSMSDAVDDFINRSRNTYTNAYRQANLDLHLHRLQEQREMVLRLDPSDSLRRSVLREEQLSASEGRYSRLIDISTETPIDVDPGLLDLYLEDRL